MIKMNERIFKMNKTIKILVLICISVFALSSLTACTNTASDSDLWDSALYTEDTEFGNGSKTVMLKVEAEEKSVVFTINSDKKILGDALLEHKLISGEEGAYGLYVKSVNGMVADYDINQSFWSLCKDGTPMTTGVDGVSFEDGESYEFVYTK